MQQVNHVLHPARNTPAKEPDLRQTNLPNVPYRSDTLKANLERLIGGLAPPSARGASELIRLTDWHNEFNRTAMYCSAYFISWALGYTVIVCTIFWMVLIAFPETRRVLFPYVSALAFSHTVTVLTIPATSSRCRATSSRGVGDRDFSR